MSESDVHSSSPYFLSVAAFGYPLRGEGMPNGVIYCNSFEVSHSKEAFCMVFKFQKPDGSGEISMYVVMSPQGCKTILNLTTAEMTAYETEYGKVEAWNAPNPSTPNNKKNPLIS